MSAGKIMAGYILYAIGIIGGVEGVTSSPKSIPISVVALIVIVIASFMLKPE